MEKCAKKEKNPTKFIYATSKWQRKENVLKQCT